MTDQIYPTLEMDNGRGCGTRDPQVPYLCTGVAKTGMPIEHFVYDPVLAWNDVLKRGYSLVEDKEGINHVVMFVSKNDYPHWWDFVTESRAGGVSRKVADNFPFQKLTPDRSTMRFVHARAIPEFGFQMLGPMFAKIREQCRLHHCKWQIPQQMEIAYPDLEFVDKQNPSEIWPITSTRTGYHPSPANEPCAYSGAEMGYFVHSWQKFNGYEIELWPELEMFKVHGPSFTYSGFIPKYDDSFMDESAAEFKPGMFMWSEITHIEFFAKDDKKSKAAAENAGYDTLTLNY